MSPSLIRRAFLLAQTDKRKTEAMFNKLVTQHAALVTYVKTLGEPSITDSPTVRGRGYTPEVIDYRKRKKEGGESAQSNKA